MQPCFRAVGNRMVSIIKLFFDFMSAKMDAAACAYAPSKSTTMYVLYSCKRYSADLTAVMRQICKLCSPLYAPAVNH